ncbi:hypothetical protein B4168_3470 [Anoxybacillus flavithermus]|nr:hypothetical protein B4168_3470 [Anoxybacillus flavithermus]OAO84536.1 hypothetical protein GT23_3387 [Parageobacillus thermoglucosidasius]
MSPATLPPSANEGTPIGICQTDGIMLTHPKRKWKFWDKPYRRSIHGTKK